MPSSPEVAQRWTPDDFATSAAATRTDPRPGGLTLFEVAADAGIPDAVLAPARRAAEAEGYAAGWAAGVRGGRAVADEEAALVRAGRAAAEREHRELITAALGAVQQAADQLEARTVTSAESIEDLIVKVAYDLAESLIGAALRDDRFRGEAAVRRVLAFAPRDEPVTVALHPSDHAVLVQDGIDDLLLNSGRRAVTLVPDPAVAPGDAVATNGAMTIEGRLGAALARARQALLGADAAPRPAVAQVRP